MIIFSGKIEGESFLVYNARTCIRARRRAFISEGEAYIYIHQRRATLAVVAEIRARKQKDVVFPKYNLLPSTMIYIHACAHSKLEHVYCTSARV